MLRCFTAHISLGNTKLFIRCMYIIARAIKQANYHELTHHYNNCGCHTSLLKIFKQFSLPLHLPPHLLPQKVGVGSILRSNNTSLYTAVDANLIQFFYTKNKNKKIAALVIITTKKYLGNKLTITNHIVEITVE